MIPAAMGRFLGARIRRARYAEFDGDDHLLWMSPTVDDYIDTVHDFLAEHHLAADRNGGPALIRRMWSPFETLTPGERRCVRLAQRGLSNASIAETLGLSVRTVENNLSRSFAKLGVRTRVELALIAESSS